MRTVVIATTFLAFLFSGASAQTSSAPGRGRRAANPPGGTAGATPKAPKKNNDPFGPDNESKGPTEITAKDAAQFDVGGRTAVFTGMVKVIDPQFTMTADKLTVHLNREEDGGGLDNAEAEGHVLIVHLNQPRPAPPGPAGSPATGASAAAAPNPAATPGPPVRSTGKGERALYEAKDGSVTLLGWPEVTQGLNTHISMEAGVKMVIYRDGRMKTYGSTRTVIQDKTETTSKSQTNVTP